MCILISSRQVRPCRLNQVIFKENTGKALPELNILAPEYLERALSDIAKVFSGETVSASEYEFIAKDGSRRFGEVASSPIFVDGKVVATTSVGRDITDRKRVEEEKAQLGSIVVTTTAHGDIYFAWTYPFALPRGTVVAATATDAQGNTSEFSDCAIAEDNNIAWPLAKSLDPLFVSTITDTTRAIVSQRITKDGQSRWYKFSVTPNSQVVVLLTHLPANYDLTIYKDIAQAYTNLTGPEDLTQMSAEFAPDAFAPDAFAPDAFASAQLRSLLGVSAFDGTTSEGLMLNTWNNTGDFYIRVRGRHGVSDPQYPYTLTVYVESALCNNVSDSLPEISTVPPTFSFNALILTDLSRMAGSACRR